MHKPLPKRPKPLPHRGTIGRALLVVVLLLSVSPGTGAMADLQEAAGVIEQAFRTSDASLLRPVLPERGKVQLSIPTLSPRSGYFSPEQVQLLLSDLLRRHPVRSCQFHQPGADKPARAMLQGRMTVMLDGKLETTIRLEILLVREADGWFVREIRERYQA